jgi:hypothetical protein
MSFPLKVKDLNDDGQIVTIMEKQFYNLDNQMTAAEWVREPIKGIKPQDAPQIKSSVIIAETNLQHRGKLIPNSLGYFHNAGNTIQFNGTLVNIFTSCFYNAHGLSILPSNFNRVISLFTARKLIDSNWINQKDEYMVPNVNHPDYQQWNNDCVIFSLFHSASNQSSLRQIDYKDKKWDIINQWFWMNNNDIKELANNHNNLNIYNDCQQFPNDSFVYKTIQSLKLSDDALQVLSMAKELVIKSFPYRKNADEKYHLNAWDAGWYQIKNGILKDFFADDLKAFSNNFKQFGNRLREGVYKFGFLK